MIRAAASGAGQKQQAAEALQRQQIAGEQQGTARGQMYGNLAERGEARKQQGKQFDAQLEQRQKEFKTESAQREDALNLRAAESGFERSPREQKLMSDMERSELENRVGPLTAEEQQRLKDQGSRGMQADGARGGWVPNQERQEDRQFGREQAAYKARTERIRAEAYRMQVGQSFAKAQIAGDKEAMERNRNILKAPLKQGTERFNRMMSGKKVSGNDWAALAKEAESFDVEPTLMADIKAQQWTDRVQAFAGATNAKNAMKFIAATGDFPMDDDGNVMFDMSSQAYQNFNDARMMTDGYMKMLNPLATWAGINSIQTKNQFLNRFAADAVLAGIIQGQTQGPDVQPPGPQDQQQAGGGIQMPQQSIHPGDAAGRYGGQAIGPDQGPDQAAGFLSDAR